MGLSFGTNDISEVDFGSTSIGEIWLGNTQLWSSYTPNYLTFTPKSHGGASDYHLKFCHSGTPAATINLEFNINGSWTPITISTSGTTLDLQIDTGRAVQVRGTNNSLGTSVSSFFYFQLVDQWYVSGDVNTLLNYTQQTYTLPNFCFYGLFSGGSKLYSAPILPATNIGGYAYCKMFEFASTLTTPPSLPATTLGYYCYKDMFSGCSALTSAPALSATNLSAGCYQNMFGSCTALTTTPVLSSINLADYCYKSMFLNCTNLVTVPQLPATGTLPTQCYHSMFHTCSSLQVYQSSGTGHTQAWRIPTSGSVTLDYYEDGPTGYMFYGTTGSEATATYSRANMTFYTQNAPV